MDKFNCNITIVEYNPKVERLSPIRGHFVKNGNTIEVAYSYGEYLLRYVGEQKGSGHWDLKPKSQEERETLSLHCMPDDTVYEGHYFAQEDGKISEGFWRIELD